VNGTRKIIGRSHTRRSFCISPAFRLSAGRNVRYVGRPSGWVRHIPGYGACPLLPPGGVCPPPPNLPFSPVAYFLPANTRLGYSPKSASDGAYHNTSCQSGGKTNQRPDKKTGGIPGFPPAASLSLPGSPVFAALSPVPGAGAHRPRPFSRYSRFHHYLNPKKDYLHV